MNKYVIRLLVFVAAVVVSVTGAAAGGYVGASAGQGSTSFDSGTGSPTFDSSAASYKVLGGYRMLKFFGVEGDYRDLGSQSDDMGGQDMTVDTTSVDLFAVGVLPIGLFEVFGKAGYSMWDSDLSSVLGSSSDSGNDLAYGIGAGYAFGKVGVRVEYELFDIEDADNVSMFSVGAEFRF
jgi:hypothetical protein